MPAASTASHAQDPIGLRLIAAADRSGGIGRGNQLLFRLKTDMAYFRSKTAGKPVVMGRKTWESLPRRPLPNRPNIIVTRNTDFLAPGAFVFSSIPVATAAARAMAARMGVDEACVIGGSAIYAAALPFADRLSLTSVEADRDADVFFPKFDIAEWRETSVQHVAADADNEAGFTICELVRK